MGRIPKAEKERALINESLKQQKFLESAAQIMSNCDNSASPTSNSNSSSSSNNNNNVSSLITINYSKCQTTDNDNRFKKHSYFDKRYANENNEVARCSSPLVNNNQIIINSNNNIVVDYLTNELHQIYLKFNKKIFNLKNRAANLIRIGKFMNDEENFFDKNVTNEHIWAGLVQSIPEEVSYAISFSKEMPGVSDFKDSIDFGMMIDKHLFDFYLVSMFYHAKFYF